MIRFDHVVHLVDDCGGLLLLIKACRDEQFVRVGGGLVHRLVVSMHV